MVGTELGCGPERDMTAVTAELDAPQAAEPAGYPARLRTLIALMTVAAAVVISFTVHGAITGDHHLKLAWAAGAVAALLLGDLRLVEIRLGSNGNQFTWGEAALILGVTLVGWDWFVPIGAATLLARQLLAGRLWQKALFNAAAFCVGNFLSRLAFCAVMGRWA